MATLHLYLDQNGKDKVVKGTESRGSGKERYEVEVHRLHGLTIMDAETPNPYVFSINDNPTFPPEILACVRRCTLVTGFTQQTYGRTAGIYELDGAIGTIERSGGDGSHYNFSGRIEAADPDKLFKLYEAIRDGSLAPTRSFDGQQLAELEPYMKFGRFVRDFKPQAIERLRQLAQITIRLFS